MSLLLESMACLASSLVRMFPSLKIGSLVVYQCPLEHARSPPTASPETTVTGEGGEYHHQHFHALS